MASASETDVESCNSDNDDQVQPMDQREGIGGGEATLKVPPTTSAADDSAANGGGESNSPGGDVEMPEDPNAPEP